MIDSVVALFAARFRVGASEFRVRCRCNSYVRRNEGVHQVQCHNRHRRRLGCCFAMQTEYRFILIHLLLAMSFVALVAVMFVGESTKDRCCTRTHDAGPRPHSLIRCPEPMQVQMDGVLAANPGWPAFSLYFSLIFLISNLYQTHSLLS